MIRYQRPAELYDGYLNDFYRSLKAWRTENELAGRIECGRSLRFLGELLFALEGVRAPYPKEWAGKLGELEPLILDVARTGDPDKQRRAVVGADLQAQLAVDVVVAGEVVDVEVIARDCIRVGREALAGRSRSNG